MPPRPGSIRSRTTASKLSLQRAALALRPVVLGLDGEALRLHAAPHEVDDPRLVLDQQDRRSHRRLRRGRVRGGPVERCTLTRIGLGGVEHAVTAETL